MNFTKNLFKKLQAPAQVAIGAVPNDPTFLADSINANPADNNWSSLIVERGQVGAPFRYKNPFDKNVDYVLLIQRSTGRFSERYTVESDQPPSVEQQGRCVVPAQK